MGIRLEPDDAALSTQENLPGRQDQLEAENHALRSRLRSNQRDPRPGQKVELLFQILFLARVGAREADRDGGTRIVGHSGDGTPL